MLTIDEIRAQLERAQHPSIDFSPEPSHASVAMILCEGERELEACFIRRAERDGDPWTGQVAFPGGRAGPGDPDPAAVAERETLEEIGLDLRRQVRIGPLPTHSIQRSHSPAGLTLSPFVYHADARAKADAYPRLAHEVAAVFWVPLSHLFDARHCTELEYPTGSRSRFSGIAYHDHVIWGLTLRVLGTFADLVMKPLPALA